MICKTCNIDKTATTEFFPIRKDFGKIRLRRDCIICYNTKNKIRAEKHRDDNPEKVKESGKKSYYNNIDKRKNWYQNTKENRLEYRKNYYENNKNECIQRVTKYAKNKYNTDAFYKMKVDIRSRVYSTIQDKKMNTSNILGCDWNTFKSYIESKFKDGMSWENHGRYGWHYDHIIPVASAKNEKELIVLNHYTNFQPLWSQDNLRKGCKISEEWENCYTS
jgi:hypothetical protein